MINDITERKQAEDALTKERNLLRTLIDHSPDWCFVKDVEGRFLFANAATAKLLGTNSPAEVIGKTDFDFSPQEIAEKYHAEEEEILQTGVPLINCEQSAIDREGNTRWFLSTKVPCRDHNGAIVGIVGLHRDITDCKWVDEQASQHQAELAHASRLSTMGEMASKIAHELNQPLTAIANYVNGCVRMLRSGAGVTDELIDTMEQAAKEAKRAGEIIRWIRAFVSKREAQWRMFDLKDSVLEVLGLIRAETRQHGVLLYLELSKDLLLTRGELIQIEQVILNLVRNGCEAMSEIPVGSRKLTIHTSKVDERSIELAVRDTGHGLSNDIIGKIFDPFFTTKPEGMGMGLSISRSIIEAHGGRLWTTSNPDRGATFRFSLPSIQANDGL